MKKKIIFKLIAISLPFILIFLLETTLRLVGYGKNYQLFNKVVVNNKPDYLEMNKSIAGKYFKDNGLRSDNQSDLFLKIKNDSTFRVFVQGASTVVGFPFYRGGSFPRMLKHRLSLTFPQKNIEVINTGITAVNSYTLNDLTDDIIAQKPDLIIIYAGHNEYYGALGVGSSISYGSHPTLIRTYLNLKKFRFFQLLENSYYKIASSKIQKPSERKSTLMKVMAREQRIPFNSDVYFNGLSQFENNLENVLKQYKKHNIPVVLSTIVSNEKDIQPFISDSIPNKIQFYKAIEQGGSFASNLAYKNAKAAYFLGRHYLEKNKDSAKKYLHLAKELDYLRFRAPEDINNLIVKLSKKHNTYLVDMKSVFSSQSTHEIIGNELMTEHVHPNVKGQFIMADAFYNKIKDLDFFNNWDNYISYDEAIKDIPISKIDSLQGKLVIDILKQSWPYNLNSSPNMVQANNNFEATAFEKQMALNINKKLVKWDNVMALAYKTYKTDKDFNKALHVAQSLIFEYPEQGTVYQMAGEMSLKLGEFDEALYYYNKFNALEKSSLSAEGLALAYVKLNRIELAKQTLFKAQKNGLQVKEIDKIIQEAENISVN